MDKVEAKDGQVPGRLFRTLQKQLFSTKYNSIFDSIEKLKKMHQKLGNFASESAPSHYQCRKNKKKHQCMISPHTEHLLNFQ